MLLFGAHTSLAIWPADVKPGTGFDDAEDVILDDVSIRYTLS